MIMSKSFSTPQTHEIGHNEVSSTIAEPMRDADRTVEKNHDKLENLVLKDLNSSKNLNAPCNDIQKYYELLKEKRVITLNFFFQKFSNQNV